MVIRLYSTFGFTNIAVKLSTRPEEIVSVQMEMWDRAEASLAAALAQRS